MKARFAPGPALAVIVVAAGGYVALVQPCEAGIAELTARTEAVAAQVDADERAVRDATRLRRLRGELARELAGVDPRGSETALVAAFLADVERLAGARAVRVVAIKDAYPLARGGIPAPGASPGTGAPFDAVPLELRLTGPYRAVLRTIAELPRARVLMRIDETALTRGQTAKADGPLLDVALKLTLLALRPIAEPGAPARLP